MIDVKALCECFSQACYQHVSPHMDKYQAEKCMEDCLPLMEPQIFAGFAYKACCDVASLVNKLGRQQYDQYARNVPAYSSALQELAVEDDDENTLREQMLDSISGFNDALNQYYPSLERFRQMLAQANDHGGAIEIGLRAGAMLGGGLLGILAGAAGGLIRGAAIDREMQAESERLQQAFSVMLKAYDEAMDFLVKAGVGLLISHHKELVKLVGAA